MSSTSQASAGSTPLHADPPRSHTNSFLIGREKPGTQSEVARLISETLEQEKSQQEQQHRDDPYEQSTEEVSHLGGLTQPWPLALWLAQSSHTPAGKVAVNKHGVLSPWGGGDGLAAGACWNCAMFAFQKHKQPQAFIYRGTEYRKVGLLEKQDKA